jgi:hypothetical protein
VGNKRNFKICFFFLFYTFLIHYNNHIFNYISVDVMLRHYLFPLSVYLIPSVCLSFIFFFLSLLCFLSLFSSPSFFLSLSFALSFQFTSLCLCVSLPYSLFCSFSLCFLLSVSFILSLFVSLSPPLVLSLVVFSLCLFLIRCFLSLFSSL